MQVDIKQINATSKEIDLVIESEQVDKAYQKYLVKSAKSIEVPGFRKGKAPLSMVEKLYSEKIRDYFEKDYVDEAFNQAAVEHDIHFLLYPEVKELSWTPGSEMTIKIEIEIEPDVEIKQTEGLVVPFKPIQLEDEVAAFVLNLTKEHMTSQDVEIAEEKDQVYVELSFDLNGKTHTFNVDLYPGDELPMRSLPELMGAKTGDKLELEFSGRQIKLLTKETTLALDNDTKYPCSLVVNSVLRYTIPEIDDDFAKDMDFENLEEMRNKIGEDLQTGVEHRNFEGQNAAIVGKIFTDNPFNLPPKTLRYIVEQEMERMDPKYRELLYQYYIQNIIQEMSTLYIMKALKKLVPFEMTDELMEQYIQHRAILEDMSVGAYKEANKDSIAEEEFQETALKYQMLRYIAATCEYVEPEPEPEHEHEGHDHEHEHTDFEEIETPAEES